MDMNLRVITIFLQLFFFQNLPKIVKKKTLLNFEKIPIKRPDFGIFPTGKKSPGGGPSKIQKIGIYPGSGSTVAELVCSMHKVRHAWVHAACG